MTEAVSKVLGSGRYEANWGQGSNLVTLTARGVLPCSNYVAQLEQRPDDGESLMWNMVFFVPDNGVVGEQFFTVTATMVAAIGTASLVVFDAAGDHEIPIKQQSERESDSAETREEMFAVYAKLPKQKRGHAGCIIVPADSFVTAIHYRAFGPASVHDCEVFLHSNCFGAGENLTLQGGEIPWPPAE